MVFIALNVTPLVEHPESALAVGGARLVIRVCGICLIKLFMGWVPDGLILFRLACLLERYS
jgi:hypothetical protein